MHNQKFKGAGAVRILDHIFREKPGQKSLIDPEKTNLNYSLFEETHFRDKGYFLKLRDNVGVKRKDQVTLVDSVITLPMELAELDNEKIREFFIAAGNFLLTRYCAEENSKYCIAAQVHMDETTPHMHFAFMPVRDGKFNAKSIMTRQDLRTLHDDMESYLCEKLPFMQPGYIKNGATIGVKTVDQLRQHTALEKEREQLEKRKKQLEAEIEEKQSVLKIAQEQLTELHSERAELTSEVVSLQEERKSLSSELNSLKNAILSLTGFFEKMKDKIKMLGNDIRSEEDRRNAELLHDRFSDIENEYRTRVKPKSR